jgi:acyl-homoserine lactone synthase
MEMAMLHVVTHVNRHLYGKQLEEMHRRRYELFVLQRGWNLPVRDGGEYDEGDDDRAVYLIALNGAGECRASIRVRPADDFSYLIDHMPAWVEGDAQSLRRDPDLWEMARWINENGRSTGQEIRIGLLEYLLSRGASQAISCPDVDKAEYALSTGWRVEFLGQPRHYPEGGQAVATSLRVSVDAIRDARTLYGRRDFFLIEIPAEAPWARLPLQVIDRTFRTAARTAASAAELNVSADARLRAMESS